MARRRYSDDDRANALAALAANGNNLTRTAAQLGIPIKTLENWQKGRNHPEAAELGNQKKEDMAAALEDIAWKITRSLPAKVKAAPLSQAATSLGILIDKMRLLRGEPSSYRDGVNLEEAADLIGELLRRSIHHDIDSRQARPEPAGEVAGEPLSIGEGGPAENVADSGPSAAD